MAQGVWELAQIEPQLSMQAYLLIVDGQKVARPAPAFPSPHLHLGALSAFRNACAVV